MIFGVVGDVHGDFEALEHAMQRHGDAAFWLSVGDVASDDMRYPQPVAPLYWIHGNNEDFAFIQRFAGAPQAVALPEAPANLHFLANGSRTLVLGVAVAALGGTFAPTWYDTPAAGLPFPSARLKVGASASEGIPAKPSAVAGVSKIAKPVRDDKRRHFVREQVDALKVIRGVDVLLTHEAPRPFIVQAGPRRLDAGKTVVSELLVAMRPRLHFFGHHHRFSDAVRDGVRSIGLDVVSRSYVLVNSELFDVLKVDVGG